MIKQYIESLYMTLCNSAKETLPFIKYNSPAKFTKSNDFPTDTGHDKGIYCGNFDSSGLLLIAYEASNIKVIKKGNEEWLQWTKPSQTLFNLQFGISENPTKIKEIVPSEEMLTRVLYPLLPRLSVN